ncbi:hypothetical protein RB614_37805 [Phytohabitans sp. ZYX-F-186]|uniref:Tip attachment protein J domain-containing protein n=1 Tax=Phytohabitans maris TaxID=3071409 RepID=A0ABU0ZVP3_9ACTN|nr:hypothetical protein [Phytohabitans sp. ZYX-F-186]MDQ7910265.1 hypothetical protein [Phytohabitans sp. ZYX-F-186]
MHSPLGIRTEVLLGDGTWGNISTRVRRDGGSGIGISRGRKDERGRTVTSLNLTLEDPDGDFNDLNPMSPYYGLIGPNTRLRVSLGNSAALEDDFNRSAANTWAGGPFTWIFGGGTVPDDYDLNGNKGLHTHASTNVNHFSYADVGERNHRVRTVANLSVGTLTGAGATTRAVARLADTSNWYAAFLSYATSGQVNLQLSKTVGGVGDVIGNPVTIGTFANLASTQIAIEIYVEGNRLYAKAWDISDSEPVAWMISETDDDLSTGTNAGVSSRRETGNTNANLQAAFDSFLAVPGTFRAHVEVPNFGALRWAPGGADVTQSIQGAGIKRRLGSSGTAALKSPLYRYITRNATSSLIGYWACEDGEFTSQIGSANGAPPINVLGTTAQFGSSSSAAGASSMIRLGDGVHLDVPVLSSPETGQLRCMAVMEFPDAGLADDTPIMLVTTVRDASVRKWYLEYRGSTGGDLRLRGFDQAGSVAENSGYGGAELNGKTALVYFDVAEDGADVDYRFSVQEVKADGSIEGTHSFSGTFSGSSVGAPTGLAIAPTGAMDGASVCHIMIGNDKDLMAGVEQAVVGHFGETTTTRFGRLCDEEGVAREIKGNIPSDVRMGAQRTATLLQNLEDVEDAEHGIIYEARHFFGLVLRMHENIVNQTGPDFSYVDGFLTGEPFPDPDDLLNANDVTATRIAGSEYRSVEEEGRMSVQDPPNGIGRYDKPVRVNIADDSLLPDIARWNRHVGTWRSARYPLITFDTHRPVFTAQFSARVDELDIGDYFSIPDTPAWLEPGPIEQLAQGYNERIENVTRTITFNCRPAGPYQVAVRGLINHRDSAATVLGEDLDTTETDVTVAVTGPLWVTGSVDFNIMVGGELMAVTNISGSSSPQTFTVTRSANGVVKTHAAGAEVHVHPLPVRGLADVNVFDDEDIAGDRVMGRDFPPAVWAEGEATGNFTSGAYIEDANPVGVVFTVPPTGTFVISIAGQLDNDNAAGFTMMSFNVRLGSVLGEGFLLLAADDARSILNFGASEIRVGKSFMYDGFTPFLPTGYQVNVTLAHRRVNAGNSSITRRLLLVRPARTQGGRPGSPIGFEDSAETNNQAASDTTTSTVYTTADMTTCGTVFVAPDSGQALVHVSSRISNSGAGETYVSFEVRDGGSIGSGSVVRAATDASRLSSAGTNQRIAGASFPVTGLTPGNTYNVRLMHRTAVANTGTLQDRFVNVEPVA